MPSDTALERGLRTTVQDIFKGGNLEDLTVKRVRTSLEAKLKLPENFFKDNTEWKDRSKTIIQQEVDAHNEEHSSSLPKSPSRATPPPPQPQARVRKRKFNEQPPKKRQGKGIKSPHARDSESPEEVTGEGPSGIPVVDVETEDKVVSGPSNGDKARGEDSESDMSIVLDEEPRPKKNRRSKSESKARKKSKDLPKAKKPVESQEDPDAQEIKRLQGWLVKCGIRKMWFKELAPYDTRTAKIKHLRQMLADAGMPGRYSKEKADQIREKRELDADLEAVTEGNKAWGKEEEDEEQQTEGRPKRRLARSLQGLDFLNDDDGEETD